MLFLRTTNITFFQTYPALHMVPRLYAGFNRLHFFWLNRRCKHITYLHFVCNLLNFTAAVLTEKGVDLHECSNFFVPYAQASGGHFPLAIGKLWWCSCQCILLPTHWSRIHLLVVMLFWRSYYIIFLSSSCFHSCICHSHLFILCALSPLWIAHTYPLSECWFLLLVSFSPSTPSHCCFSLLLHLLYDATSCQLFWGFHLYCDCLVQLY